MLLHSVSHQEGMTSDWKEKQAQQWKHFLSPTVWEPFPRQQMLFAQHCLAGIFPMPHKEISGTVGREVKNTL